MKRITFVCCCMSLLLASSGALTNGKTTPSSNRKTVIPASSATPLLPDDPKIESKYDGFNRETIVTLKKMSITCGAKKGMQSTLNETCVSFVVSLHCPGVQLDYVRYAKLQLVFESKNWDRRHPLDERDLIVVVDGEQHKLGRMALANHGNTKSQLLEVMREVLEVSFPYKTFQKIALSEIVEMKVGKTMFALPEKNLVALRDLNNRVKL
jgi:hypothetical protein